jgi:putative glycosyl hydrolase-like family 15 (GHL15) protein
MHENRIEPQLEKRIDSHGYPRLANQIQACCTTEKGENVLEYAFLWDVVVVDPSALIYSSEYLGPEGIIRRRNPNALLFVYFSAGDTNPHRKDPIFSEFHSGVQPSWLLRDKDGNPVPLFQLASSEWTLSLNPTTAVQRYLPDYLQKKVLSKGLVDGIFYDWIVTNISWLNHRKPPRNGLLDFDSDGHADSDEKADRQWIKGITQLLENSRGIFSSGTIILGNAGWNTGATYSPFLNGIMIEQFLEGAHHNPKKFGWGSIMKTYAYYENNSQPPQISIVMTNDEKQTNFRKMRFGLCSTLLFNGYFCFTNRKNAYRMSWWYDEYSVDPKTGRAVQSLDFKGYLGQPISVAHRADAPLKALEDELQNNFTRAESKVWRRDFQNGIVLVNPSGRNQTVELNGIFRKIIGIQDPQFNDGQTIREITMGPEEGAILLRDSPAAPDVMPQTQ